MTNAIKPFCRHKVKRVKKDRKMEKEKDILAGIGRRSGMTVPEGYFENFAERMKAMLPEQPEIPVEQAPAKINVWQRLRPYVYMAAMFAGVWLMMKMFTSLSGDSNSLENKPALVSALSKADFPEKYYAVDNVDDYSILDELYDEGVEVEDLMTEEF